MEKSTYLENLRAGYLQTGAMFAQFAEPGAGGEERLRAQVGYLAELSEAMQGADIIRLYGLEVTGERPLPHDAARFLTHQAVHTISSFLLRRACSNSSRTVAACSRSWLAISKSCRHMLTCYASFRTGTASLSLGTREMPACCITPSRQKAWIGAHHWS